MSSIDSPLGKKKFTSTQELKQFEVPDEEFDEEVVNPNSKKRFQEEENFIKEMQEAKRNKILGKERMSDGAKRRIEILCGLTREYRDVVLSNEVFFKLKTLKSKETRDATNAAISLDGIDSNFELRRQLLARSICEVSGNEFNLFLSSDSLEDKLNFVDELDEQITQRLYSEYIKLNNESTEKYSLKTDADVKDMVDNLKK